MPVLKTPSLQVCSAIIPLIEFLCPEEYKMELDIDSFEHSTVIRLEPFAYESPKDKAYWTWVGYVNGKLKVWLAFDDEVIAATPMTKVRPRTVPTEDLPAAKVYLFNYDAFYDVAKLMTDFILYGTRP